MVNDIEDGRGDWAVLHDYGFRVVRVIKTTTQTVFYTEASPRERRAAINKIVAKGLSEKNAKVLTQKLKSAHVEYDRRSQAARMWFSERITELSAEATASTQPPADAS